MFINKWKNPTDQIIKYLYKNDTGYFIDKDEISEKLNSNEEIYIDNIIDDLESREYVETNRRLPGIDYPPELKVKPGVRIAQKGREYYKENLKKGRQSLISYLTLLIGCLTFWFLYLQPMVCKEKKIIPVFDFKIINKTKNKIDLHKLNELKIWLPAGKDRNYETAEYEIQNMNEIDSLISDQSRNFKGKILNENRYFEYFKNGDCDFTISLNNSRENISNHLPFTKVSITEDTLKLIIE